MKAFYEQYGNGAAWTCPSDGMWGGWDNGGMMGGHEWDASHMWGAGHGAAWMANHPRAFGHWLHDARRADGSTSTAGPSATTSVSRATRRRRL